MKKAVSNDRLRPVRGILSALCGAVLMQCLAITSVQAALKGAPTDFEINAAVEGKLEYDSAIPFNEIDAVTDAGIVIISGTVPNILAKDRATAIAETVKGVRSVVNNLSVEAVSRTDDEIRKDVDAALRDDPTMDSYKVKAAVNGGVVTLTGTVDSWQAKGLSASVAKGVKGVKELKNAINVVYKFNRPDSEIAADVKATLNRDAWVEDQGIATAVKEGVVTLTGAVGSAAEKSRAYLDAYVSGVTSVDESGLSVQPWETDKMMKSGKYAIKSDADLQKAVKDALAFDPRIIAFNPGVTSNGGWVILTGTVNNLKAKRAAEQDAKNTAGVWRVKNLLRVRFKGQLPNGTLAKNVKDALLRDPYMDAYQINVDARHGAVYLTGAVDSYYEKTHAEDLASKVKGVTAVNNNLSVSFPAYTYTNDPYSEYYDEPYYYRPLLLAGYSTVYYDSDAAIKDSIENEFFWSPFVNRDNVHVAVSNGVATLTGVVDNWHRYRAAAANAWKGGANNVVNNLTVK